LRILETGLRLKKKSVRNIIREWDSKVFPNTDSSLIGAAAKSTDDRGVQRAMDALEADSDENEDEDQGNGEP
jgi:hypothetical protein